MTVEFFDLVEANPKDPKWPHYSSLGVRSSHPKELFASGVLPHGYAFTIRNKDSRDRLVEFLQSLEFTEEDR